MYGRVFVVAQDLRISVDIQHATCYLKDSPLVGCGWLVSCPCGWGQRSGLDYG